MSAEVLEALKQGDTLMKAMADPRSETGRAFGVLGGVGLLFALFFSLFSVLFTAPWLTLASITDLTRQQNSQEWRQVC